MPNSQVRLVLYCPPSTNLSIRAPNNTTKVQLWQCAGIIRLILNHYHQEGEAFLHCILTTHETWIHSCEPELNRRMVSPRTTTPTKRVTKLRHMKHIKAYDYNSILLARAVPLGTTVKTVYCTNFLELPFQPHCTLIYCIS